MFSSKNRLRRKEDINNVFKRGGIAAGNFIFLRFTKNDLSANRFALVVSSKISKKAVSRNKIKRQLREVIQGVVINAGKGFDFVVIARPTIVDKKFKDIKKETDEIFGSKFNKIISKKRF
jgi:ribonuclease P protein component